MPNQPKSRTHALSKSSNSSKDNLQPIHHEHSTSVEFPHVADIASPISVNTPALMHPNYMNNTLNNPMNLNHTINMNMNHSHPHSHNNPILNTLSTHHTNNHLLHPHPHQLMFMDTQPKRKAFPIHEEEKKTKRLLRNREAARKNRLKKKEYLTALEEETNILEKSLKTLQEQVGGLENEFLHLRELLGDKGCRLDTIPHYQSIMNGFQVQDMGSFSDIPRSC